MTGICGNYDRNRPNDLRVKNGTQVPDDWRGWNAIGNSWRVPDEVNRKYDTSHFWNLHYSVTYRWFDTVNKLCRKQQNEEVKLCN